MFIHEPYCEYGEIVPYHCTAIVFNPHHGAKMIVPSDPMPHSKGELALAAFFRKLNDEDWVDNLITEVFPDIKEGVAN